MTRKSRRELERELEDLNDTGGSGDTVDVVWRDERTGEYVDLDGEPTEPDPDTDLLVVMNESVVMSRERAEKEDREILGPAEDVPEGRDVVRVPTPRWDS